MTKLNLLSFFLFLTFSLTAQQYNDVAVIVNDNSIVSQEIADYFQAARNIPELNMIHIEASESEVISPDAFEDIRIQIENYLTDNNLKDEIHYLVTTKGVPLKVTGLDCENVDNVGFCASFDSELSLIFSSISNEISEPGSVMNPYFDEGMPIADAAADIYLVSRLDGYVKEDVFNLIDRSGPEIGVNQLTTNSLFDISNLDQNGGEFSLFGNLMENAIDVLSLNDWETTYHPETNVLTDQENIFAYYSVNYNPAEAMLNHDWVAGSVAELFFHPTANTFDEMINGDNNVLAADLIAEGATGVHAYVTHFYSSTALDMSKALGYYTDQNTSFNLAESFYMGTKRLSGASILIGDPKTSIVIDNTVTSSHSLFIDEKISVFPNPGNGLFTVYVGTQNLTDFEVFDQLGRVVQVAKEKTNSKTFAIDLSSQASGVYFLNLSTEEGTVNEKLIIAK